MPRKMDPKEWRRNRACKSVNGLRQHVAPFGCEFDSLQATDPFSLAETYLGCQITFLDDLTDRRALHFLETTWKVDISGEKPNDLALAGCLYVTSDGAYRWLFVENTNPRQRQRWTVAHEIGHLFAEVLPDLERRAAAFADLFQTIAQTGLLKFGRCSGARIGPLTKAAKLELDADDFAAELLMPLDGVRKVIADQHAGGFRSESEVSAFVRHVRERYDVSREAATVRITDDLGVRPYATTASGGLSL